MFAAFAAVCFIVATFKGDIEDVRLMPFGLFWLALHHVVPWPWRHPNQGP